MTLTISTFPMSSGTDAATAYFAPWWVRHPQHVCPGWDIDYSTARCVAILSWCQDHWHGCFEGVVVKDVKHQQVWRLTGNIDELGRFEGRWPD
jgi:hypothetical protein